MGRSNLAGYEHLAHAFDEHVIRSEVRTEGFASWLLMRPHSDGGWTRTFWARVTAANGLLTVVGDFDPVVFAHYGWRSDPEGAVAWMGGQPHVTSYVLEKASIGTGRNAVIDVDVDEAREELREMADEEAELAVEYLKEGDEGASEYHYKRAEAFRAGSIAWVEEYSGMPYSAASVLALIEAVESENDAEIERCDAFSRLGERASVRVILGHLAVRRLHGLLEARPIERTVWGRVRDLVKTWLQGGVLALLQGECP